jgi:hypothetical protein
MENRPSVKRPITFGSERAAPKVERKNIGGMQPWKGFESEPRLDEEPMEDEEKVLAGRADANIPALLTKDVHGG